MRVRKSSWIKQQLTSRCSTGTRCLAQAILRIRCRRLSRSWTFQHQPLPLVNVPFSGVKSSPTVPKFYISLVNEKCNKYYLPFKIMAIFFSFWVVKKLSRVLSALVSPFERQKTHDLPLPRYPVMIVIGTLISGSSLSLVPTAGIAEVSWTSVGISSSESIGSIVG